MSVVLQGDSEFGQASATSIRESNSDAQNVSKSSQLPQKRPPLLLILQNILPFLSPTSETWLFQRPDKSSQISSSFRFETAAQKRSGYIIATNDNTDLHSEKWVINESLLFTLGPAVYREAIVR